MHKVPKNCCHEAIKPIAWLIGKWKNITGEGFYPTIEPFTYCDEITFESIGQPLLNYMAQSWDPIQTKPLHLERGFLRIKPGTNQIAFMVAHNIGVTSIEEGEANECEMRCQSTQISSMSFVRDPHVCSLQRLIKMNKDGNLEINLFMETVNTPLTQHLKAEYRNC